MPSSLRLPIWMLEEHVAGAGHDAGLGGERRREDRVVHQTPAVFVEAVGQRGIEVPQVEHRAPFRRQVEALGVNARVFVAGRVER